MTKDNIAMDIGFQILDVHHHVGNAFGALGGEVDATPDLARAEFERIELDSRLAIMDRSSVQQALVIPAGHRPARLRRP